MAKRKKVILVVSVLSILVIFAVVNISLRGLRLWNIANDMHSQVRYLVNNGETISTTPASTAFSEDYLRGLLGDDSELLSKVQAVLHSGTEATPGLALGEVAAMLITYRRSDLEEIEDLAVHVFGGFPLGKRKKGLHRDGYFRHLIDPGLWQLGNSLIGLLGRDIIMLSDDQTNTDHEKLLDSILQGDIIPLVKEIDNPLHYTVVLPDPRPLLPPQLRAHIQSIVFKGYLYKYDGEVEINFILPSEKSTRYTMSVMGDMKKISEIALKTKWKGQKRETPWGDYYDPWWAFEMVETSERMLITKHKNVINFKTDFERVMVNAVLKAFERMGRDLAQMSGSLDKKLDPRVIDKDLKTKKPLHYWSEEHRWGPNWPIPPPGKSSELDSQPIDGEEASETNEG